MMHKNRSFISPQPVFDDGENISPNLIPRKTPGSVHPFAKPYYQTPATANSAIQPVGSVSIDLTDEYNLYAKYASYSKTPNIASPSVIQRHQHPVMSQHPMAQGTLSHANSWRSATSTIDTACESEQQGPPVQPINTAVNSAQSVATMGPAADVLINQFLQQENEDRAALIYYLRYNVLCRQQDAQQTAEILIKSGILSIDILRRRLLRNPDILLDLGIDEDLAFDIMEKVLGNTQYQQVTRGKNPTGENQYLEARGLAPSTMSISSSIDSHDLTHNISAVSDLTMSIMSCNVSQVHSLPGNNTMMTGCTNKMMNVSANTMHALMLGTSQNASQLIGSEESFHMIPNVLPADIAKLYYEASVLNQTTAYETLLRYAQQEQDDLALGFWMRMLALGQGKYLSVNAGNLQRAQCIGKQLFPKLLTTISAYINPQANPNLHNNTTTTMRLPIHLKYMFYLMGVCYSEGLGVEQNHTKSIRYYKLAATNGLSEGIISSSTVSSTNTHVTGSGHTVHKGIGVPGVGIGTGVGTGKPATSSSMSIASSITSPPLKSILKQHTRPHSASFAHSPIAAPSSFPGTSAQEEKGYREGYDAAQAYLGYCYYRGGCGVPKDYLEAVKWYRMSANEGYAPAQCNLGICYEHGHGVPHNVSEAMKYYQFASLQQDPVALFNLGYCYERAYHRMITLHAMIDHHASTHYHASSSSNNRPHSTPPRSRPSTNTTTTTTKPIIPVAKDGAHIVHDYLNHVWKCSFKKKQQSEEEKEDCLLASSYYQESAKLGYKLAQYTLGNYYYYGFHGEEHQSYVKAFVWYALAAYQDYPPAACAMGMCYEHGHYLHESDYPVMLQKEMMKYQRQCAEQEAKKAQPQQRSFSSSAEDRTSNNKLNESTGEISFRIYSEDAHELIIEELLDDEAIGAVAPGNTVYKVSQPPQVMSMTITTSPVKRIFALAEDDAYWRGKDCMGTPNFRQSIVWYERSRAADYAVAWYNLGYYASLGVTETHPITQERTILMLKDEVQAMEYYTVAAKKGYAAAQNNLGYCYFQGVGVMKQSTLAVKWYRASADQGYPPAAYNLGYCYEKGIGGLVSKLQDILTWYRLAAGNGNEKAQRALEKINCPDHGAGTGTGNHLSMSLRRHSLPNNTLSTAASSTAIATASDRKEESSSDTTEETNNNSNKKKGNHRYSFTKRLSITALLTGSRK